MMQVKGLAAILKFLLRSDNLSAIQNMDASKRDDYIERLVSAPHLFNETVNTSGTCPPDIVDLTDMAPEQANAATVTETAEQQPECNASTVCQSVTKSESLQQLLAKNAPQTPSFTQVWRTGIEKTIRASPRRSGKKTRSVPAGKGMFAKGSSQKKGHIARRQNKQKELASMSAMDRCLDRRIPIITSKGQTIPPSLYSVKHKK